MVSGFGTGVSSINAILPPPVVAGGVWDGSGGDAAPAWDDGQYGTPEVRLHPSHVCKIIIRRDDLPPSGRPDLSRIRSCQC